jgi:hypothetical protein
VFLSRFPTLYGEQALTAPTFQGHAPPWHPSLVSIVVVVCTFASKAPRPAVTSAFNNKAVRTRFPPPSARSVALELTTRLNETRERPVAKISVWRDFTLLWRVACQRRCMCPSVLLLVSRTGTRSSERVSSFPVSPMIPRSLTKANQHIQNKILVESSQERAVGCTATYIIAPDVLRRLHLDRWWG